MKSSCEIYFMKWILIFLFPELLSIHLEILKYYLKQLLIALCKELYFQQCYLKNHPKPRNSQGIYFIFSKYHSLYKQKNISTTQEDIEEAFIQRGILIRNLKRNLKADEYPVTLVTFSLVCNSDRTELLKSGLIISNQKLFR